MEKKIDALYYWFPKLLKKAISHVNTFISYFSELTHSFRNEEYTPREHILVNPF